MSGDTRVAARSVVCRIGSIKNFIAVEQKGHVDTLSKVGRPLWDSVDCIVGVQNTVALLEIVKGRIALLWGSVLNFNLFVRVPTFVGGEGCPNSRTFCRSAVN